MGDSKYADFDPLIYPDGSPAKRNPRFMSQRAKAALGLSQSQVGELLEIPPPPPPPESAGGPLDFLFPKQLQKSLGLDKASSSRLESKSSKSLQSKFLTRESEYGEPPAPPPYPGSNLANVFSTIKDAIVPSALGARGGASFRAAGVEVIDIAKSLRKSNPREYGVGVPGGWIAAMKMAGQMYRNQAGKAPKKEKKVVDRDRAARKVERGARQLRALGYDVHVKGARVSRGLNIPKIVKAPGRFGTKKAKAKYAKYLKGLASDESGSDSD